MASVIRHISISSESNSVCLRPEKPWPRVRDSRKAGGSRTRSLKASNWYCKETGQRQRGLVPSLEAVKLSALSSR